MSLITVENVGVSFGKSTALSDVNFEIKRGEIVTIVGPNGSGKSTFLRAIIGAIKPSKGEIKRRKGLKIGYVPQKLEIGGKPTHKEAEQTIQLS